MKKYLIWILLALCPLFWAGNFAVGKYVVMEMTPLWTNYLRWALALFLLFPAAQIIEKPDWKNAWKQWPLLTLFGILGIICFNLFVYSALKYTSAINVALVTTLNPAVIVLFSVFLVRDKISRMQGAGFVISLIGVLTILTKGDLIQIFRIGYNRGNLLMIGALIAWSAYSILGRRLVVPPITATAISSLFAVVIMTPFAIAQGFDMTTISPLAIKGILFIVIFPSACAYIFWNLSIRAVGANKASIFLNLNPVFTALISIFLGDKITGAQIWGGLCVFIGVYLATGGLNSNQQKEDIEVANKIDTVNEN